MKPLHLIKIGGNTIDDPLQLDQFLRDFASLPGPKLLVHGGGKLATDLALKLGVEQTLVEGRRITDAETLDIAVMVYAGLINKRLVAKLQALGTNALGLCGADLNLVTSTKRAAGAIDFGFVGDVKPEGVNAKQLHSLLEAGIVPVLCALSHDGKGSLLNTNADTLAAKTAIALSALFETQLSFCFDKEGVLRSVEDGNSWLPEITKHAYQHLKAQTIISKGMIPKLDEAFAAAEQGVKQVLICHARNINSILTRPKGTLLSL